MLKTSIRFFEDIPVRAVWDDETSKWWFCAMDIAEALTKSSNPRSYWNALKRRKNELSTICRQLKLKANDGKSYLTDVVDENGVTLITALIPAKNKENFTKSRRSAHIRRNKSNRDRQMYVAELSFDLYSKRRSAYGAQTIFITTLYLRYDCGGLQHSHAYEKGRRA